MLSETQNYLKEKFGISDHIIEFIEECESELSAKFKKIDEIGEYNQYKVLNAFQENRINDSHFAWNTGYGYNDMGRDATENVFSNIFGTEDALVRTQIVNGTHALSVTFAGLLRPGDEMIYCSGNPYDSLWKVIGLSGSGMGSLKEFGIDYNQVDLTDEGDMDYDALKEAINKKTKMVCLQRATGYSWRPALTIEKIKKWVEFVKSINPEIICMVDNCYGEFLDTKEPTNVGVDIMAGSLIKNPGGGLALSGGYAAGKADLIEKISYRLTCPGIGGECGLTFGQTRTMLQGMFYAPRTVAGAVKGAVLCSSVFDKLGFGVCPEPDSERSDIVQAVKLESPEAVNLFCEAIQSAAAIDSYVTPVPGEMAGYDHDVIMASGSFVQGSTMELSADSPVREPYIVYFQGGISYEHSKFGVMSAVKKLSQKGYINLI